MSLLFHRDVNLSLLDFVDSLGVGRLGGACTFFFSFGLGARCTLFFLSFFLFFLSFFVRCFTLPGTLSGATFISFKWENGWCCNDDLPIGFLISKVYHKTA